MEPLRHKITTEHIPQRKKIVTIGVPSEEIIDEITIESTEIDKAKAASVTNQDIEGEPFLADLDRQFPKDIAILYVESEGDKYYFHIHNPESTSLETEPEAHPKLTFTTHMSNKELPQTIRGFVKAFSQNKTPARKLRGWLMKLQQTLQDMYGAPLSYLIINDRTSFEIPWEMLDLNSEEPIGAAIAVVRWQDIPDPADLVFEDDQKLLSLSAQPNRCCGRILAYANARELQAVKNEIEVLKSFNSTCYENMHDFLNSVDQFSSELSLLFIASHGFFKENIGDMALGEQRDSSQKISLVDLYNWDFTILKSYPSIVFMNACHSGRLCQDYHFNVFDSEYRAGFATFFLSRGAKGVIGVMGEVGDQYAAHIAQKFFHEYQDNSDLTVPELLRNLRAEVTYKLRTAKTDENWYLFHYTFMYVYYGHPLTKLSIFSSAGG